MGITKFIVGGVPEHFNLPIHLFIEQNIFLDNGIDIRWKNYKGGTGEMTQALRNEQCDICIILTEGIIADIIRGNPSKIIGGYVNSSLIWGIHTGLEMMNKSLQQRKIAISRLGSGSHLMPIVEGLKSNIKINDKQFVITRNLEGGINALGKGLADVFYWEKFTTKPYVDKKIIRRIGEFHTPWPCFVVAATNKAIDKYPAHLSRFLSILYNACIEFKFLSNNVEMISKRFDITYEDAALWLELTEWYKDNNMPKSVIDNVVSTLYKARITNHLVSAETLCWNCII